MDGVGEKGSVSMRKATEQEVQAVLQELGTWTVVEGKLHREYRFRDFVQAIGFMAQAALVAERSGHHPEWFNVYNRVIVDLTTHDAQGITQKDFDLARAMERLAGQM